MLRMSLTRQRLSKKPLDAGDGVVRRGERAICELAGRDLREE